MSSGSGFGAQVVVVFLYYSTQDRLGKLVGSVWLGTIGDSECLLVCQSMTVSHSFACEGKAILVGILYRELEQQDDMECR